MTGKKGKETQKEKDRRKKLEDFAILLSSTKLTGVEKKMAKKEGIVIVYKYLGEDGFERINMVGAMFYQCGIDEEDPIETIYFDALGVLDEEIYYGIEGYSESFEHFIVENINRTLPLVFKMDTNIENCNFPYLPFQYQEKETHESEESDKLEQKGIIFYKPPLGAWRLNKYRRSTYENQEMDSNEVSPYWSCDACGGNQDSGCLSSTDRCYR